MINGYTVHLGCPRRYALKGRNWSLRRQLYRVVAWLLTGASWPFSFLLTTARWSSSITLPCRSDSGAWHALLSPPSAGRLAGALLLALDELPLPELGGTPMTTTGRTAGAIDRALGLRIRQRRIMLGITQQQLAELIGVTFQQAHKYEKGLNRLSVSRLFTVAEALGTSVTELLAGLEPAGKIPSPTRTQQRHLKLASAFARLTTHEQTAVLSMVRLMARRDAAA